MAPESFRLQVRLWGVRGSTPTPHADQLGYGGNTSCIEVRARNGQRIIIDAGTGIRNLGRRLVEEDPLAPQTVQLFFTHFHWDHIQGLPFFAPLLQAGQKINFHSFPPAEQIRERLARQMSKPYFTLDFNAAEGEREFSQIDGPVRYGALSASAFPLNHPQGACGYRIEAEGATVVIATDLEHGDKALDRVLRENAEGADVMIYDAQYTPEEYAVRRGWGHSTYSEAAQVATDANVKRLILFHHDPTHDDRDMAAIEAYAVPLFENTCAARETHVITL